MYVPEYFDYKTLVLLFFLTTMGKRAKKQRAADAKAAKKAKKANSNAAQLAETPSSASTDTTLPEVNIAALSNTSNLKKKAAAPTRQSICSRGSSASSSTLGSGTSGKNRTSANLEGNDNGKSRPQRAATAAALALLQDLQASDTEEVELDPEGVFTGNDEVDRIMELEASASDDGGSDGDSNESSESDIVMVEELPAVARKTLSKPKMQKKSNLKAIEEEDSESSSDGE